MERELNPSTVFRSLDGRTCSWLVKQIERDSGLKISSSAMSNYSVGYRRPSQATLRAVKATLSASAVRKRVRLPHPAHEES
jgi:hypothetical protein